MDSQSSAGEQLSPTRYLKPWRPGQSGNPGGRPKGLLTLQQKFRRAFNEPGADHESLSDIVLGIARDHENPKQLDAIKFVAEYAFGKAPRKLDDATVVKLAEQMVRSMLQEAEVRASVREAIPIEEAPPAEDQAP